MEYMDFSSCPLREKVEGEHRGVRSGEVSSYSNESGVRTGEVNFYSMEYMELKVSTTREGGVRGRA